MVPSHLSIKSGQDKGGNNKGGIFWRGRDKGGILGFSLISPGLGFSRIRVGKTRVGFFLRGAIRVGIWEIPPLQGWDFILSF